MRIFRHGDVVIRSVTQLPEKAKEVARGKERTIALGEATGHHHTLYGSIPEAIIEYGFDERRFVQINEELDLKHQEHEMLRIPQGTYEIIIEREHDYFERKIKQVRD